ncbi:MAG TPA: hypothetical protein VN598_18525 [Usitatibacter sp.]|nr:hypothetical protein [Usitatibacter sp.]
MGDVWVESIRSTGSIGELLEMARRYVATWDAARIEALAHECRPPPLVTSDDLSGYALTLLRRQLSGDRASHPPGLEEMGRFFAAAAVRLAEILALSRGLSSSRAFLHPIEIDEE